MNLGNAGLVNLSDIAILGNIRHNLKPARIKSLAASIKELGIQTPLTVEPLENPENGAVYGLRTGHYRYAALQLLAKEGMDVQVPVIVDDATDELQRLKLQVSENNDRENLSPMDLAHTIDALLTAGMSKPDIRAMFPRPGGRGGKSTEPMSNATLNMYHRFLEFPKDIQNKIHSGQLGVHDAYLLHTKDKTKWTEILAQAEKDRQAELDQDDSDEEKFLNSVKKTVEAQAKAEAEKTALKLAQEEADKAKAEADKALSAAADAYNAKAKAKTPEAKAAADEALKAQEAAAKAAEKEAATKQAAAEKLAKKATERAEAQAERAKKLADARKASGKEEPAKKGKKLDVDRAAAKVTGSGSVKLTGPELHKMITELAAVPSGFPKVQAIFVSLKKAADGDVTESQLLSEIAYITGERKEKPKTLKG